MAYIYGIFIGDKCIYIGSTDDIERRWKQHKKSLEKGKHTNLSLQKAYNKAIKDGLEFEYTVLKQLESESTLIKFMFEGLYNSLYKPSCAKIVISQGRNRIILSRCSKELAEKLIEVF